MPPPSEIRGPNPSQTPPRRRTCPSAPDISTEHLTPANQIAPRHPRRSPSLSRAATPPPPALLSPPPPRQPPRPARARGKPARAHRRPEPPPARPARPSAPRPGACPRSSSSRAGAAPRRWPRRRRPPPHPAGRGPVLRRRAPAPVAARSRGLRPSRASRAPASLRPRAAGVPRRQAEPPPPPRRRPRLPSPESASSPELAGQIRWIGMRSTGISSKHISPVPGSPRPLFPGVRKSTKSLIFCYYHAIFIAS